MFKKTIVESIVKYETKYHSGLMDGYDNTENFEKDMLTLSERELGLFVEYYENRQKCANDTNSTVEERKELDDLILEMQGFNAMSDFEICK